VALSQPARGNIAAPITAAGMRNETRSVLSMFRVRTGALSGKRQM
jgi:hypothetical protein